MLDSDKRYAHRREQLAQVGQSHLLTFWNELSDSQRVELLDSLDAIDFVRTLPLIDTHVRHAPTISIPAQIEPPPSYPYAPGDELQDLYRDARNLGEAAVRAGRVAAFTVAGGQGTRLGFPGPKGAFPISPIRNATLFQLFAEYLVGIARRYDRCPRWYIMTSAANHEQTTTFFQENAFFGLPPDAVRFFQQGQMPAFYPDGRIALEEKYRVALSPNGHGGSLWALADSGALADMRAHGIDTISYFQVDNPLVKPIDTLFVGLHLHEQSEMSSKAISKAFDTEKVGNFCLVDGKVSVIEYSDLPDELARAKNPDGTRRFDAGSIAIHLLAREFVERITAPQSSVQLPWHRAEKKVAIVDNSGRKVEPTTPNAVKLEMFVFDAIPLARNPLVLFTDRAEEFSPVKNAEGVDSALTARRDLVRRAARWLEQCGVHVGRAADGEPAAPIEISSAYALDADELCQRLEEPPAVTPGEPLLIA